MFAQRKHEKCDVENELTINSLDHIEKADFQLNKKAEMLVYQHFYLLTNPLYYSAKLPIAIEILFQLLIWLIRMTKSTYSFSV